MEALWHIPAMTEEPPPAVRPLPAGASFRFRCHPEVACFTDCCRELELALAPYDVLRLRRALGMNWQVFLDTHALVEQTESDPFPQVFLAMVDDGRASCPFVSSAGCTLYSDRPGACRTYPLGRGLELGAGGNIVRYVLLREPHCQGFQEAAQQDVAAWTASQELQEYFNYNDLVAAVLQHPFFRKGGVLSPEAADAFVLALYDLDGLRRLFSSNPEGYSKLGVKAVPVSDEDLLRLGIQWFLSRLDKSMPPNG